MIVITGGLPPHRQYSCDHGQTSAIYQHELGVSDLLRHTGVAGGHDHGRVSPL
jgi:hypothetical protein